MTTGQSVPDFPGHSEENRRVWDANALWWDDRIGDGNDFQTLLIEPATERLLAVAIGDVILDVACGAGRFARRMAELGARVVAFDQTAPFIERARERTPPGAAITYHMLDAAQSDALVASVGGPFDKAVCTMAMMDMPEITPLADALTRLLVPGGAFVFSVTHPCFNMAAIQRFAEMHEDETGRHVVRTGVKVTEYHTPFVRQTEGIIGQPVPQHHFHRPLHVLLAPFLAAGFVVDGIEEPALPVGSSATAGVRWSDMPEIPPILVIRMRRQG
ncbi:MAG: class I SAM-dependent methyltransferase [Armatimonadetes bacterium]|nr:class I SAM-dependent methyltransferase [Armatimonadota bacterium]